MRVTLLHNKSAGSENHAAEDLEASVRRAGHEILDTVPDHEKLLASIQENPPDLVVIAGGDGTVSRAACALAGCSVPLSVFPLGTANNTARSLGMHGEVDGLVQRWSAGHLVPFDLAAVVTGKTVTRFSEAVGWGVFPALVADTNGMSWPSEPTRTLERDRALFHGVIAAAEPRPYSVRVDGVSITGEFLLVEVMNIPLLGPRLAVSPASDFGDGLLEVVLAGSGERSALLELASTGRIATERRLRTLRGKQITVRTDDGVFHRDGSLVERAPAGVEFSLRVEPASVRYLLPSGVDRAERGRASRRSG